MAGSAESSSAPLRAFRNAVDEHGLLKLLWAPVSILAAIGGSVSLFHENWPLVIAVVTSLTTLVLAVLVVSERLEARNRGRQLESFRLSLAEKAAVIEQLEYINESVRWITERMGLCCSGTSSLSARSVNSQNLSACSYRDFDNLEAAVMDCTMELLGSNRRVAIYYGSKKRFEPAHKSGWKKDQSPPILVSGKPKTQEEVEASDLFEKLRESPGIYVQDVLEPEPDGRAVASIVSDKTVYRSAACFRLAAVGAPRVEIHGILLVQDSNPDALSNRFNQEALSTLANVLTASYLTVRGRLARQEASA